MLKKCMFGNGFFLYRMASFQTALRTQDEGADTIVWLALQANSKLQNGALYFDRKIAAKHLAGAGTKYTPDLVSTIVSKVHTLCGLPPKT